MKKTDKIFHIHKKAKFKLSSTVKRIIFACSASIIIGLVFGAFFLHMIKQEESTASVIENAPTSIESNEELRELASIEVFVVQGGVFSEIENYQTWENKYNNIKLPVVKWERDNSYHLLAGIAKSKSTAKETASKLSDKGLDVFVKQWIVTKKDINVSETEHEWLLSFIDLWNKSLLDLESNKELSYEAWENLIYKDEKSTQLNTLNEVIKQTVTEEIEEKPEKTEQILLYLLKEYEKSIVSN